jgi:hypothetical protein
MCSQGSRWANSRQVAILLMRLAPPYGSTPRQGGAQGLHSLVMI